MVSVICIQKKITESRTAVDFFTSRFFDVTGTHFIDHYDKELNEIFDIQDDEYVVLSEKAKVRNCIAMQSFLLLMHGLIFINDLH